MPALQSHNHKRPGPDLSGEADPTADRREEGYGREIREIQSELAGLRSELRRFIEHANRQNVDAALSGLRRDTRISSSSRPSPMPTSGSRSG